MAVRGMEQRSRAVQKGDERQSHGSVTVRLAAKLQGQTALQKFERRHVFFAREGERPIFGDEAVVIGMRDEEVQNPTAGLRGRARGFDGREKIQARAAAQQGEKIFFVGKTFVQRRSGGSRGARDGAHSQGMFAAAAPQAISGLQDAAFKTGVGFTRHAVILPLPAALNYILYSVKDTMYK